MNNSTNSSRPLRALTLIVLSILAGAVLTACGGGSDASPDTPDEAAEAFLDAVSSNDASTACGLVSDEGEEIAVTSISGVSFAGNCEDTVDAVPDDARETIDGFETETTDESGEKATVQVTNDSGTSVDLEMVKDGDSWAVNGLAGF